jgi:murein DD-endopeptidase MepM/ murein hydrolase activator NlpD
MDIMRVRRGSLRIVGLSCALWLATSGGAGHRTPAQAAPATPPFGLPFAAPPGPSTWLLGGLYGNTTGAYRFGDLWYKAGQGLHFGLDFVVPCGTPIVSIGDGEVVQADWTARGAGPHNLIVRHPDQGVTVLYGHLHERPNLVPGQKVHRGEVVAKSGDPDLTCDSRPHLHLEVRSPDYRTAFNPLQWIDADWNALLLMGSFGDISFTRDRADPLKWVRPLDQPDVQFGGAMLNDFHDAWPDQGADGECVVISC